MFEVRFRRSSCGGCARQWDAQHLEDNMPVFENQTWYGESELQSQLRSEFALKPVLTMTSIAIDCLPQGM